MGKSVKGVSNDPFVLNKDQVSVNTSKTAANPKEDSSFVLGEGQVSVSPIKKKIAESTPSSTKPTGDTSTGGTTEEVSQQSKKKSEIEEAKKFLEQDFSIAASKDQKNYKAVSSFFGLNNAVPTAPQTGNTFAPANPVRPVATDFESVVKYADKRRNEIKAEIDTIKQQNPAVAVQGGIMTDTMLEKYAQATKAVAEKLDYINKINDALVKTNSELIIKKQFGDKPVSFDTESMKSLGVLTKRMLGDNNVDDDLAIIRNADKLKGRQALVTKQIKEADNWLEGRKIAAEYLDNKIKTGINKVGENDFAEAVELRRYAVRNTEQNARLNELMAKPELLSAIDAYDKSVDMYKTSEQEFKKAFPEVARRNLRVNAINALNDIRKQGRDKYNIKRVAQALVGTSVSEEDIPLLAKKLNVSENEIREIANQEVVSGSGYADAGASNLRIHGFLSSLNIGFDQIVSGAQRGVNRLFLGKEQADVRNAIISNRSEEFTTAPDDFKIFKKDGINLNLEGIVNTMGETSAQLVAFVIPNMAASKLFSFAESYAMAGQKTAQAVEYMQGAFDRGKKVVDFISTTTTGTLSSYEDAYQEAAKYTVDQNKRHGYALVQSLVTGMSENILSPTALVGKLRGTAFKPVTSYKAFEKAIRKEGLGAAIVKAVGAGVVEGGKVVTEEVAEELMPLLTKPIAENTILDKDTNWGELGNEMVETIVQTAIGTALVGAGAGINKGRSRSKLIEESLFEAGMEPERYVAKYRELAYNGQMDQDEANKHISAVNTMAKIVKGLPEVDKKGNPMTIAKATRMAAEQFRIRQAENNMESAEIEAEKQVYNETIEEARANQEAIMSGDDQEERSEAEQTVDSIAQKIEAVAPVTPAPDYSEDQPVVVDADELPTADQTLDIKPLTEDEKRLLDESPEELETVGVDLFNTVLGSLKAELPVVETSSIVAAGQMDLESRKQALKDLMKATGVDIYEYAVADGSFNGEGFLDMDIDGNVILTRFADTEENLTKGGQVLSPEDLVKGANNHSYTAVSTSAIEGGVPAYGKEGGVVGKYKIPFKDLLDLMNQGYAHFAGVGNKEFVLSPHIAEKYLDTVNGEKKVNKEEHSTFLFLSGTYDSIFKKGEKYFKAGANVNSKDVELTKEEVAQMLYETKWQEKLPYEERFNLLDELEIERKANPVTEELKYKIAVLANGPYQKAIEDGSMTATQVKDIMESAGLEVPADILKKANAEIGKAFNSKAGRAIQDHILKRLKRAFLRIDSEILANSEELMAKAIELGGTEEGVRYNVNEIEKMTSALSIPDNVRSKLTDAQFIKLVDGLFYQVFLDKESGYTMNPRDKDKNRIIFLDVFQFSGLTIQQENELYNYDQVYRELMDLDEKGELDEAGKEKLTEIYKANAAAAKLDELRDSYILAKKQDPGYADNYIQSVEKAMPIFKAQLAETLGITENKTIGAPVKTILIDSAPVQVKPLGVDVVNGFYSPLEKMIADTKLDNLSAKQWIEKFGKGEEALWTGLSKFLSDKAPTEKVKKAEIKSYLKNNRVEIVEVVKSEDNKIASESEILDAVYSNDWVELGNGVRAKGDVGGFSVVEINGNKQRLSRVEAENLINKELSTKDKSTKFKNYQLEGEKENYKEVLVTMPKNDSSELSKIQDGFSKKFFDKTYAELTSEEKRTIDYQTKSWVADHPTKGTFKSSHFDEPNILVHLRMNTRKDAEGNKVLFLEEIQSDWGQKGKKEGFDNGLTRAQEQWLRDFIGRWEDVSAEDGDIDALSEEYNIWLSENKMPEMSADELLKDKGNVSKGPFVTDTNSWTKLGLKIALKQAVAEGLDKIAWITGEQQNDRYDLSKTVDLVSYAKDYDGTYVIAGRKNGETIFRELGIKEAKISDYVGKDVAEKIINNEGVEGERYYTPKGKAAVKMRELSGEQLKVGGKGMKGFYGSTKDATIGIVGNVAKSLFKQEPKTVGIQILKLQPSGLDENNDTSFYEEEDGNWVVFNMLENKVETYSSEYVAKKRTNELNSNIKEISTQYSIDITSELKAQVNQGLPLFKFNDKGEVLGFTFGGKLYLNNEKLSVKTTMEEAGHVWVNFVKENRPDLYAAGIEKISEIENAEEVLGELYVAEALRVGEKGSFAYEYYLKEELLAKAIADEGDRFFQQNKRKSFKSWVNNMWREVISFFGIRNMNPDQIKKLTLVEFAQRAAADVFYISREARESKTKAAGTETLKRMQGEINSLESQIEQEEDEVRREMLTNMLINAKNSIQDLFGDKEEQITFISHNGVKLTGSKVEIPGLDLDVIAVREGLGLEVVLYELSSGRIMGRGNDVADAANRFFEDVKGNEQKLISSLFTKYINKDFSFSQKNPSPAFDRYVKKMEEEEAARPFLYSDEEKERIKELIRKAENADVNTDVLKTALTRKFDEQRGFNQKLNFDFIESNIKSYEEGRERHGEQMLYPSEASLELNPSENRLSVEEKRKRAITKAKNAFAVQKQKAEERGKETGNMFLEDDLRLLDEKLAERIEQLNARYDELEKKSPSPKKDKNEQEEVDISSEAVAVAIGGAEAIEQEREDFETEEERELALDKIESAIEDIRKKIKKLTRVFSTENINHETPSNPIGKTASKELNKIGALVSKSLGWTITHKGPNIAPAGGEVYIQFKTQLIDGKEHKIFVSASYEPEYNQDYDNYTLQNFRLQFDKDNQIRVTDEDAMLDKFKEMAKKWENENPTAEKAPAPTPAPAIDPEPEQAVSEMREEQRNATIKKLLSLIKEYNTTASNKTATLSDLNRQIQNVASKINATVGTGEITKTSTGAIGKRKLIAYNEFGDVLRMPREKKDSAALENRKTLNERGEKFIEFYEALLPSIQLSLSKGNAIGAEKIELDIPADYVRSGLNAIAKGKYNENAFDLLDKIQVFYESGMVPFFIQYGQQRDRMLVNIEQVIDFKKEAEQAILDDMQVWGGLDPQQIFDLPEGWTSDLDDRITEILGEDWTPESFLEAQDSEAFQELYDSAFPDEDIAALVAQMDLIAQVKDRLEEVKNQNPFKETTQKGIFFHGTGAGNFEKFKKSKRGTGADWDGVGDYGRGFYFTPSDNEALNYALNVEGNQPFVKMVFLDMKKPFDMRILSQFSQKTAEAVRQYGGMLNVPAEAYEAIYNELGITEDEFEKMAEIENLISDNWDDQDTSDILKDAGYDSLINYNHTEFVVFSNKQIKQIKDEIITEIESAGEKGSGAVLQASKPIPEAGTDGTPKGVAQIRQAKVGLKYQLSTSEMGKVVEKAFEDFDRFLNPDDIREYLRPYGYDGTNANMFRFDMERMLGKLYDLVLSTNANKDKSIHFVLGAPGVGKSGVTQKAEGEMVWDGVFTDGEKLSKFVARAIENNIKPIVSIVYNTPLNAYLNIVKRYMQGNDKRVVPLTYFINAFKAQSLRAAALRSEFGDNVEVIVYDNSANTSQYELLTENEESMLQWEISDELIEKIKNEIQNEPNITDAEKIQFLGSIIGKRSEEGSGGIEQEENQGQGGEGNALPAEVSPDQSPIGLVETPEQKAVKALIQGKEQELVAATKALKAKASKLDNDIKKNTPDLFGGKAAPASPLGFDDIDVKARAAATKKEREKVDRLTQELYELNNQLEILTGKPSAQKEIFDQEEEVDGEPMFASGLLNTKDFANGDFIQSFYSGEVYQVVEADKKGMGTLRPYYGNDVYGADQPMNAYNNPHFFKVNKEEVVSYENYITADIKIPEDVKAPRLIMLLDQNASVAAQMYELAKEAFDKNLVSIINESSRLKELITPSALQNKQEGVKLTAAYKRFKQIEKNFFKLVESDYLYEKYTTTMEYVGTLLDDANISYDEDSLELLVDKIYSAIYEFPGNQWSANMPIREVIQKVINQFTNTKESGRINATDLIRNTATVDDVARYLDVAPDSIDAQLVHTLINYLQRNDIAGLLKQPEMSTERVYQSIIKPALNSILGIELPNNAVTIFNEQRFTDILTSALSNINNIENEQVQNNGASASRNGGAGSNRTGAAKNVSGKQSGAISSNEGQSDIGTKPDTADNQGGGQLYQKDSGADGSRTQSNRSEGNRVSGTDSGVGPTNYRQPEGRVDTPTFNKAVKYKANIAALKVLVALQVEGRLATKEEQDILSGYIGFGGLKEILLNPELDWNNNDEPYKQYVSEIVDLIKILDPTGSEKYLDNAKAGILNAHYTPAGVIKGMWNSIVENAGFNGGAILEPAAGIGNFITSMPEKVVKNSSITAVEKDALTGLILKNLLPKAAIHIKGLEVANLPANAYDLVISNVPFGDFGITDSSFKGKDDKYKTASQSIHNYFFAKGLDLVRPGGVVAFITSRYTMDSTKYTEVRELISEQGQFLGALRMPNTAFKGTAGTEVITDIIFIRKYNEGEAMIKSQPFIESSAADVDGESLTYNDYFKQNPDMILGKLEATSSQFGMTLNVAGDKNVNLEAAISEAGKKIFKTKVYEEAQKAKNERIKRAVSDYVKWGDFDKIGNIVLLENNGVGIVTSEIYIDDALDARAWEIGVNPREIRDNKISSAQRTKLKEIGLTPEDFDIRVVTPARVSKENLPKAPYLVKIRNIGLDLVNKEIGGYDDQSLDILRAELKNAYDEFVKKFGQLNNPKNLPLIKLDVDQYFILALEKQDDKSQKKNVYVPSDIFTKRTVNARKEVGKITGLNDAILVSLEEFGYVNPDRLSSLLDKPIDQIIEDDVEHFLFKDIDGSYITRDEYLSGDVKTKLAQVDGLPDFKRNYDELVKIIPEDISAIDIYSPIFSRWIPIDVLQDFVFKTFNSKINLKYIESTNEMDIEIRGAETPEMASFNLAKKGFKFFFDKAINNEVPIIYVKDADGNPKKDEEQTLLAQEKVSQIERMWDEYKYADEERRIRLQSIYNDMYNREVDRKYDGSHLQLPGLMGYSARPHQKDAIWRFLQTMNGILDHMVGAGKSLVMMGIAMEGRRLGKFKKPMIIGLKSQVPGYAADFKKAYPLAKILFPSEKDFSKESRKTLMNQIATNDWDCIMLTHSQFGMLKQSPEILGQVIEEQIADIRAEMYSVTDKDILKKLETALEKLQKKYISLQSMAKDDDVMNFAELGIDFLMVDESQEFKNLEYTTKLKNVKGLGNTKGSKRAFNLLIAARTLQNLYGGDKGLVFASGTPISNSMAELYLLTKFLVPKKLKKLKIDTFDKWAALHADATSALENFMGRFKEITRFRKFTNLPELINNLYRSIADVRNATNLELDRPAGDHYLEIIDPNEEQLALLEKVDRFIETKGNAFAEYLGMTNGYDDKKGINPSATIMAMTYSKKLSLDPRLLGHGPGKKIEKAANNIAQQFFDSAEYLGTQLVFCDLGTPKTTNKVENLYEHILAEYRSRFTDTDLEEIFGEDFNTKETKPPIAQIKKKMLQLEDDGSARYMEMTDAEFEALVVEANQAARFDAYSELKTELIKRGIPAEQVAFIHDYNTNAKKAKLFDAVNDGLVRVVIGSTSKLGVGVNVQKRLIAMHHLDITYKPADLEQRNGRGLRQMNIMAKQFRNNVVKVYYYATRNTLDSYMYGIVATKAKFIAQMKVTGALSREMEDIEEEIDADTMSAQLSGNPIYKERADLQKKLRELNISKKGFDAEKYRTQDRLRNELGSIKYREQMIETFEAVKKYLGEVNTNEYKPQGEDKIAYDKAVTKSKSQGEFTEERDFEIKKDIAGPKAVVINDKLIAIDITINGKKFDKTTTAGEEIQKLKTSNLLRFPVSNLTNRSKDFEVGEINGLKLTGYYELAGIPAVPTFYVNVTAPVLGEKEVTTFKPSDNDSSLGRQLKDIFYAVGERIRESKQTLKRSQEMVPKLQEMLDAKYSKQEEFDKATARAKEVDDIIRAEIKEREERNRNQRNEEQGENGPDLVEESKVQYAKSSTGGTIKFAVYPINDQRSMFPNQIDDSGDFVSIERRYEEQKHLSFMGKEKITSNADVAWLFRSLETEAVENSYAVHVRKDGSYFVQHIAIGDATSVVVDAPAVVATAIKMKATRVFFIHNHPSGQVISSKADQMMLQKLTNALQDQAIVQGIIINVNHGIYGEFDVYGANFEIDFDEKDFKQSDLVPLKVYRFSKQYFLGGYNPIKISGSSDVAALVSTRKYGAGGKLEMLVLNRKNEIIAKLSLPFDRLDESNVSDVHKYMAENIVFGNGVSAILIGNKSIARKPLRDLSVLLQNTGLGLVDYIHVESNRTPESYMDEGFMSEPESPYQAAKESIVRDPGADEVLKREKLETLAFVSIVFKNMSKGEFLNLINELPMFEKRDLRIAYEKMLDVKERIDQNISLDNEIENIKSEFIYQNLTDAIGHYVYYRKRSQNKATPDNGGAGTVPPIPPTPTAAPSGGTPSGDADFIKNYKIGHSTVVGQMESSKKLDLYMGPVEDDAYFLRELSQLGNAGDDMLELAKDQFGQDITEYAPALLRILESGVSLGSVDVMTKKVALVGRLARAIETEIRNGNTNANLQYYKQRAFNIFMNSGRDSAVALNAMKELYQMLSEGNYVSFYTKDMLDAKQKKLRDFYGINEEVSIPDDVAEAGVEVTPEEAAAALLAAQQAEADKAKEQKKKANAEKYKQKANQMVNRLKNVDDIVNRLKNLKC